MQPGAIGQGSKKDHLTLIDNWVYGEFGIIAADRAVTQGPPSVLEPYEGFQHSRLVSFVEKILSQAVDMDSDQTTMVLSDRTLLTFCQGSPSFHKYLQTHLDTKSFEEIKSLQSTVRSDFLKSLLTLEYKDLLRITQSFDHLVTSTYKYMTILTLPGMIVRRSGLISMVSDQMVLLLGYTREEMTPNRYLHEFMPCKNLYDFYTGPGTQCYRPGGTAVSVCDTDLVHKNGTVIRTRASFSLHRCSTNYLPLGVIMIVSPLDPPNPELSLPDSKVFPSTHSGPSKSHCP